jgi:hypothetical protein
MRGQLAEFGPALARLYGIRPWEHGRLTPQQAADLIADIRAIQKMAQGG